MQYRSQLDKVADCNLHTIVLLFMFWSLWLFHSIRLLISRKFNKSESKSKNLNPSQNYVLYNGPGIICIIQKRLHCMLTYTGPSVCKFFTQNYSRAWIIMTVNLSTDISLFKIFGFLMAWSYSLKLNRGMTRT